MIVNYMTFRHKIIYTFVHYSKGLCWNLKKKKIRVNKEKVLKDRACLCRT